MVVLEITMICKIQIMDTTSSVVNQKWLTRKTGDPFADIGGGVIKILFQEKGHTDIFKLIEETSKIYVNNWKAKLNAFFLNSKITQPAFKGEKKVAETAKYFRQLLNEELPFEEGYCRILGEHTKLFSSGRDNNIMVGSGTFINFHHAFQYGLMLSKEALIRMFFVPFGCVQLADKVALLQSNDEEINTFFVEKNIRENQRKIATRIADGINRWDFKSPSSALFDFAQHWIINVKDYACEENVELNLYHFTNFGATPEVVLHNFSAALFKFYSRVQYRTLQPDWRRFSHSYFRIKNAEYDSENDTYKVKEKKEVKTLAYKDFKIWNNSIYENLLSNKSILKAMLNWVYEKRRPLNFEIVKLYQINLRNMNEKTLQIIERLADFVLRDTNNLKKKIRSLQTPTKAHAFRKALRKLEEKNLSERNPDPLFSLDEYALELFPDGTYWQEIQDLLLISIYQKMHEQELWLESSDLVLEEKETNPE